MAAEDTIPPAGGTDGQIGFPDNLGILEALGKAHS
jgi:hypothetical protein